MSLAIAGSLIIGKEKDCEASRTGGGGEMETKEDVKLEPENLSQKSLSISTNLTDSKNEETQLSSMQARRRFMITDILNSAVEETGGGEEKARLDMRLLFPGVPGLQQQLPGIKYQPVGSDVEPDSDNEGDEELDDGSEKGKPNFFS